MRAPCVYALTGDVISDAEFITVADVAGAAIEVLFAPELEGQGAIAGADRQGTNRRQRNGLT